MASQEPILSVIVLSFNTREMTLQCLRTLYAGLEGLTAEVWVVDNASGDGSVDAVRSAFPQVHVISNERNLGFGAANNLAIRQAAGEYVLLLNSDAFVKAGAVRAMVGYLQSHSDTGAAGPVLVNEDGSFQESCFAFPSPRLAWMKYLWIGAMRERMRRRPASTAPTCDQTVADLFLSAACLLIRRTAIEQIGLFDESFFFYCEEADWERRLLKHGWKIARVADARVVHLHGKSGDKDRKKFTLLAYEGEDRFIRKHHGLAGLLMTRIAKTIYFSISMFRSLPQVGALLKGEDERSFSLRVSASMLVRQLTHWRFA